MSRIELIRDDVQTRPIEVENTMNINDLVVKQSRNRSSRSSRNQSRKQSRSYSKRYDRDETRHKSRENRESSSRNRINSTDDDLRKLGLDLLANPRKKAKDVTRRQTSDDASFDDRFFKRDDGYVDPHTREAFERKHNIEKDGSTSPPHQRSDKRKSNRDSRDRREPSKRSSRIPSRKPSRRPSRRPSRKPSRRPSRRPSRKPSSRKNSHHDHKDRERSHRPPSFNDTGAFREEPQKFLSYEDIQQRKQELLEGFNRLMRNGIQVPRFSMRSDLDEMESEYKRLSKQLEMEQSIAFSQKMLMAVVTGMEFLNDRYDPFGLQLGGWSESVMEDIHSYDSIFEELYEKYHTKVSMAPEFKLLFALAGSAFMFHLTNTMFRSNMPGMNMPPEMMKNMRRAAMGAMGNLMGGVTGTPPGQPPGAFHNNRQPNGPMPPQMPSHEQRREMKGPSSNMTDILSDLMEKEPSEINNRIVQEIDEILNNPSASESEN